MKTTIRLLFARLALAGGMTLALVAGASAVDPWGLPDDAPTWQPGDQWSFSRSATLSAGTIQEVTPGLSVIATLTADVHDTFTLQVTGTTTQNFAAPFSNLYTPFTALAYERVRTAGAASLSGTGRLQLFGEFPDIEYVDFTLEIPFLDTSNGTTYTGVGDLSQIREAFNMLAPDATLTITTGTLFMCNVLDVLGEDLLGFPIQCPCWAGPDPTPYACGPNNVFSGSATLAVLFDNADDGGGLELLDFPLLDPSGDGGGGEAWSSQSLRAFSVFGSIDSLTSGTLFSTQTDAVAPVNHTLQYRAEDTTDTFTGITGTRYVSTAGGEEDLFYSPADKEFSHYHIADYQYQFGVPETVGFSAAQISNINTSLIPGTTFLGADAAFTTYTLSPARPAPGQAFTVSGGVGEGTLVSARLILPGDTGVASSSAVVDNSYSIGLTAPNFGDTTATAPLSTEPELGSFGIELTLAGATGYDKKVITVRLGEPVGGVAVGDYDYSGCTDLADFLFLLDNYQLDYNGTILGLIDFLNLLDNWQLGPNC